MSAARGIAAACLASALGLAQGRCVACEFDAARGALSIAVAPSAPTFPAEERHAFDSPLAFARLAGSEPEPELILAQRVIERSWGPSDDSVYVEVDVPDWRSEPAAMGMSAAVPGLGQIYAGEAKRGMWFAAVEFAAWVTHILYLDRGHELGNDAAQYAGDPAVPASTWSFSRWAEATQSDPSDLEQLHAADPEVFYDLIDKDPKYLAGWSGGDPNATRFTFSELRRHSQDRLQAARWAATALWINHAVSAFDALRAARTHNLSLGKEVGLRVKGDWKHGRPAFAASLERRF